MNGHVSEWLGAYLDGELSAARRQKVRVHLEECTACRSELESHRRVSIMLQSAPAPEFTTADAFASRLELCLPRRDLPDKSAGRGAVIWYLVPALILAAWFFYQTVMAVSGLAGVLDEARLFGGAPRDGSHSLWFSLLTALFGGWLGELSHSILFFADRLSLLAADIFGRLFWQTLIGLIYLGWLAAWWIWRSSRQREPRGVR